MSDPNQPDAAQTAAQDVQAASPDPATTPQGGGRLDQRVIPTAAQQPARSLDSVEAAITGTKPLSQLKQETPQEPFKEPHQFNMVNWDDTEALRRAARAGGIDTDKVSEETFQRISDMYRAAHYPGVIGVVQHWVGATGAGAFMRGWDAGAPSETIPMSDLEKISPEMAEARKAMQFFGDNIQTRIIEKGRYVSSDGIHYTPPDEYKAGKVIGSVLANPGSVAGIPKMAQVGLNATLQGMGKVSKSLEALAAAHPQAAQLVGNIAKYGALGWMLHGGNPSPASAP